MVQRSLIKRVDALERAIAFATSEAFDKLRELFWRSFSEQDLEVIEQLEQRFGGMRNVEREGLSEAESEVYAHYLEKLSEFENSVQAPALMWPIWADRMGRAFK